MAAKKRVVRESATSPILEGKSDAALIQGAYEDAVKNQFTTFVTNCIDEASDAEDRFLKGLKIIRKARDRAIELVES
jgi:hypothetical protein